MGLREAKLLEQGLRVRRQRGVDSKENAGVSRKQFITPFIRIEAHNQVQQVQVVGQDELLLGLLQLLVDGIRPLVVNARLEGSSSNVGQLERRGLANK